MSDQGQAVDDLPVASYSWQATQFIAEVGRITALGLPVLPEDPSAAAAMRAAGYVVLAECASVAGGSAIVSVMGEEAGASIPAAELSAALGIALEKLPGTEFLTVLRETLGEGRVLSEFRCLPGAN